MCNSISKSSVNFVGCAVRRLAVLIVLSRRCSLVDGSTPTHCLRVSILIEKWNYFSSVVVPQHFLAFLPELQGQGSLRPTLVTRCGVVWVWGFRSLLT